METSSIDNSGFNRKNKKARTSATEEEENLAEIWGTSYKDTENKELLQTVGQNSDSKETKNTKVAATTKEVNNAKSSPELDNQTVILNSNSYINWANDAEKELQSSVTKEITLLEHKNPWVDSEETTNTSRLENNNNIKKHVSSENNYNYTRDDNQATNSGSGATDPESQPHDQAVEAKNKSSNSGKQELKEARAQLRQSTAQKLSSIDLKISENNPYTKPGTKEMEIETNSISSGSSTPVPETPNKTSNDTETPVTEMITESTVKNTTDIPNETTSKAISPNNNSTTESEDQDPKDPPFTTVVSKKQKLKNKKKGLGDNYHPYRGSE
ncbi:24326_t:CDS:2, partial [Dentiscutata erythropus]